MKPAQDGPATKLFSPLRLRGNTSIEKIPSEVLTEEMKEAWKHAPQGDCVCWGIPFKVKKPYLLNEAPVTVDLQAFKSRWLVFMHTADKRPLEYTAGGFISPMRGEGRLGEHAATYTILYADGSEVSRDIKRRFHIGAFTRRWGENCFEAVVHSKPLPVRPHHEQTHKDWGFSQTRVSAVDEGPWMNWLWAWENPYPDKEMRGFRFTPVSGTILLWGISAGNTEQTPLRWLSRRKALLRLDKGVSFDPALDGGGLLKLIQLDMGQVISAVFEALYPQESWESSANNQLPQMSDGSVLLEYTAHPEACFHLSAGKSVSVAELADTVKGGGELRAVPAATRRIRLRVVEKGSSTPVPVKLHVHGESGEYLAPVDRHRSPNSAWFEDYSTDFIHQNLHACTYIPGEKLINVPLSTIFVEVSKGFEIRPIRRTFEIDSNTSELTIEIDRILPWRKRGWVTADTHVHFLSPMTSLLEGSAEGVNVVNLLASQWGELMTNVGDFDGRSTWGSKEMGGDGEYLVRVGTENRQHVLGHISLLGYRGDIIAPMTSGGPDESALGDPIEILLTEWARQCRKQGGLVILPHFPNPRAEHAAAVISGYIDGIEMTSWGDLYSGISPYSLSDWYRYLNCGYQVPAVAGTDKMSAATAVGTVRTYARLREDHEFSYENWMDAVRSGQTFATYGPLLEFRVDGQPMGSRISLNTTGGSLEIEWEVASVTVPLSRVELMVNGEIKESTEVSGESATGSWSLPVDRSSWAALLVRGQCPDYPEIIAAHSSAVMIEVEGTPFLAAADAFTILEQLEGAMAYLDTVGTRAETEAYKRMCLVLESAHRSLHNRMHQAGQYHEHTTTQDHPEHRK